LQLTAILSWLNSYATNDSDRREDGPRDWPMSAMQLMSSLWFICNLFLIFIFVILVDRLEFLDLWLEILRSDFKIADSVKGAPDHTGFVNAEAT
jgi:hypothetical protein